MTRYTLISSDCHAAPQLPEYRSFIAKAHREAFDDWLRQTEREAAEVRRERMGGNLFDEEYIEEAEVRAMLGENAAEAYGFDLAKLAALAERVGPQVSELLRGPNQEDLAKDGTAYRLR